MSQEMGENNCSVVAYPPVKFPIKKEFIEPEELEMEDEEGIDSAKWNGEMMIGHDESYEGSDHSSLIDYDVETAGESSDEEPLLKEIEKNQHPLAYAPLKFKQHIKQEHEDEEQCCESNLTEDFTQDGESSNEGSNHSSLDGVEKTDESSDEEPPPSLSTTAGTSIKGNAMKRASKASHHKKKENSGITRRSAALLERRFKCGKCENRFKSEAYLKDHLKRTCGKERSFLCKQCDSRFKRNCHLKNHLINIHKIGPSQLSEFGAGPQDRPVMPFKCDQCDRSYQNQTSLSDHLRNKCGKNPTISCTKCEYRTKRKTNLKAHLINVHGIKLPQLALFGAGPKVRPVMPFKCNQCDRSYKHQKTLNDHLRNVCGKDPTFFCNQCEYRTKRKKVLQAHLINVHDIKRAQLTLFGAGPKILPFKCDQCERTYKIKSCLKRHVREKHSAGENENSDGF